MKLQEARKFWKVASSFPPDKEAVYPEHAAAHGFDDQRGKRVLEYGCGGGSDTISLLKRAASVVFVDIVPENVALTRRRVDAYERASRSHASRAVGYCLEHSEQIPVLSSLFDTITSHGVLHHIEVETMQRVLDEFYRILRPDGELYVMLYTEQLWATHEVRIDKLVREGRSLEEAFGLCTDGGGIARAYTREGGRAVLEEAGFELLGSTDYHKGWFRTFRARRRAR